MSTLSERMITVGEIQDMMRATRADFDELNPTEQGIMLSHIDAAIANDFLDEKYNDPKKNLSASREHVFNRHLCLRNFARGCGYEISDRA